MKLATLLFANLISSIAMNIALIIVPWELADTVGGDKVLAFTATWATAILIFVSPIAGRVTDAISRRTALIVCVVLMGGALQLAAVAYDHPILHLTSLAVFYFFAQIFFLFFYNALTAFIQEVFTDKERGKVNGWMQVEMQTSTLLVGLLMIYVVSSEDFKFMLMLNGLLMFLSGLTLLLIPYKKQVRSAQAKISRTVYLTILKRKDLVILGLCDGAIFVCVMMMNIIDPIYLSQVLDMEVSALATISISWGIGAALSGFFVGRIINERSAIKILNGGVLIYTGAMLLVCLYPTFLMIVLMLGVCGAMGAGTRVAFNTFVMSKVDNSIFGSYMAVVSTMTYIQRTVFGLVLALIISAFPASNYYWFVLAICLFAFALLRLYSLFASSEKLNVLAEPK